MDVGFRTEVWDCCGGFGDAEENSEAQRGCVGEYCTEKFFIVVGRVWRVALVAELSRRLVPYKRFGDWVSGCCSDTTVKCVRLAMPKEVVMATSEASRPA